MPESQAVGVILAGGKGTRMKSDLPKGLHKVAGVPMVELIGRAMKAAGIQRVVIVVGHRGELIQEALGDKYEYAWQDKQLGTGHAASMTRPLLVDHAGPLVIAPGDAPLLSKEVFEAILEEHKGVACTLAIATLEDPTGYGRVIRDDKGVPCRIVEEKDASPEQKKIKEVCTSLYCFDAQALFKGIKNLKNANAQGEYYLTDMVNILHGQGGKLQTFSTQDPGVLLGVNDRWQLSEAEKGMRMALLKKHAMDGVTLIDPDTTYIGLDVEIGVDTVIEPCTSILGATKIGSSCKIGPNTRIENSSIGESCTVLMSHLVRSTLGNEVKCGPFANLRPGTVLKDRVKIGNFVEVKNSSVGQETSISHLSYIGDAELGAETNIGAGTITCNYDGFVKSKTTIGDGVFVGSNSTLVAPITLEDGSFVAAGSTVTHSVPADGAAFGRARQETKEGWAEKWREKKRSQQ
ncbi:MAG TPA: bifunctional UDP-N-acetylglucosamine diphosphorylase/glucosamine-1-phosphate N-acetyltransferase GlmU [Fimbriimonas sp.]|nr:bifunctional UDP-N-acetylglucosamine diphosphorylase/glucosamine-1-phosphate N-acetyltransferase GlmU [Fimbriimonas sp.]